MVLNNNNDNNNNKNNDNNIIIIPTDKTSAWWSVVSQELARRRTPNSFLWLYNVNDDDADQDHYEDDADHDVDDVIMMRIIHVLVPGGNKWETLLDRATDH